MVGGGTPRVLKGNGWTATAIPTPPSGGSTADPSQAPGPRPRA
ncbi:hypothetical protein FM117_07985 [Micrococcus luteus Mu201]|nr:hypothetical protein FM117_07985 [Micrococcus luteus Mu201]